MMKRRRLKDSKKLKDCRKKVGAKKTSTGDPTQAKLNFQKVNRVNEKLRFQAEEQKRTI